VGHEDERDPDLGLQQRARSASPGAASGRAPGRSSSSSTDGLFTSARASADPLLLPARETAGLRRARVIFTMSERLTHAA
jgi:hypothetical protein